MMFWERESHRIEEREEEKSVGWVSKNHRNVGETGWTLSAGSSTMHPSRWRN